MGSNGLKSIADIFERKIFRIPDYQRGYSWSKKQLFDFWEDLENLSENRIHYTGVLTLEKVDEKTVCSWDDDQWLIQGKGYSPYYIVDGQQRLTTIIILLQVILEKMDDNLNINYTSKKEIAEKYIFQSKEEGISKSFLFGYEKDNPSYEFLKAKIFLSASNSNQDTETLYTHNLEFAKDFFYNKLKNVHKKDLDVIFKKVTQFLKFNVYEIEDDLDVFVAFETMNNRGKELSKLELLKNRLIYLSTLSKENSYDKDSLRKNINEAWKTIYEYLGKNKLNPLPDDDFLKNHWIMFFKYSRKTANDYIKFLLEEQFTAKKVLNGDLKISDIQEYVDSMQKSVKIWYSIFNPSKTNLDISIVEWLIKLNNLKYGAFAPLVMSILLKKEELDSSEIIETLKVMERYIFLIFRISRRQSNTGDSEFYRFAKEFYDEKIKLGKLNTEINKWIFGGKDNEGYYDIDNFLSYIQDKFNIQKDGFYGWNGLKYFLYEYDYFLQKKSKSEEVKIDWVEFNKEKPNYISIEHIYPQNSEKECWNKGFKGLSEVKKLILCNSLGNLLPLSCKKNSSLQNDCFNEKKHQKEGSVGYFNGSYSENEVAQYDQWTPDEIKQRGLKLLDFMSKRWNIKFPDENFKLKILGF